MSAHIYLQRSLRILKILFLDTVRERVATQYVPGVTEVDRRRGLLRQSSATFEKNDQTDSGSQSGVFKPDDGKWRPVIVTLGMLQSRMTE